MQRYAKGKLQKGRFSDFLLHLHPRRVATGAIGFKPTFCLGGLSALMFVILTITGLFLMFFYRPGDSAIQYTSVITIEEVVAFGWLLRRVHAWAGHAMVVMVLLHMFRVVFGGAYRPPREGNWIIGVCLLLLTIMVEFSGYLLLGEGNQGNQGDRYLDC